MYKKNQNKIVSYSQRSRRVSKHNSWEVSLRLGSGNFFKLISKILTTILFFQIILPASLIPQSKALTTSVDFTTTNDYTLEDNTKIEIADGKLQLAGWAWEETVEDVFSTYLYEGNGSTQTIENGIDLEGKWGMVWIKNRESAQVAMIQWTGLTGWNGYNLYPSSTQGESYGTLSWISPLNNGFTLNGGSPSTNANNHKHVSWTFREAPWFFDVVSYTGDGTSGRQIAHDLGIEPGMVIVKRTDSGGGWLTWHRSLSLAYNLELQATAAAYSAGSQIVSANNSTFTLWTPANTNVNASGGSYVAYLFAHDPSTDGKIQCGNVATEATRGRFDEVNLGWEPQFVIWKRSDNTSNWRIHDNMRGAVVSGDDSLLWSNLSNAENTTNDMIDFTSNGFKSESAFGASAEIIYCAIRAPQKTPVNSSEVFASDKGNSNGSSGSPEFESSFSSVDSVWYFDKNGSSNNTRILDRLRWAKALISSSIGIEIPDATSFDSMNWYYLASANSDFYAHMFKRAPGFFDVVAYEGNGVAGRTVDHNLEVEPEMVITKKRNWTCTWATYHKDLATGNVLSLNSYDQAWSANYYQNFSTENFSLGDWTCTNNNNDSFVSYLFATLPDVSKVGSYTGTAADLDIDAGFTNGAAFVLIKRTDTAGDWFLWDSVRGITTGNDPYLLLNSTAAEITSTDYIDPLNAWFRITSSTPVALNANGGEYIYLAIANDNGRVRGAYPTDKAYTAVTNLNSQIDSTSWADINNVSVTETVPAQTTEAAEAVDFDWMNDYLSRSSDLVGNLDSKEFTFSAWIYRDNSTSILYRNLESGNSGIEVNVNNSGLNINLRNSADGSVVAASIPAYEVAPIYTWTHLMMSIDATNPSKRYIYINDKNVTSSASWSAYNNSEIDFTKSSHYIASFNGWSNFKGRLSNFYLNNAYLDLSQETNRRLFITAEGKPADNQESLNPILYLPLKSAETAGQNLGTGGDFLINGTLKTSERGPNQYNAAASEYNGNSNYLKSTSVFNGVPDSSKVTFSANFRVDDMSINRYLLGNKFTHASFGSWDAAAVSINTVGSINLDFVNNAGGWVWQASSTSNGLIKEGVVYNLNVAFDTDMQKAQVFLNGEDPTLP